MADELPGIDDPTQDVHTWELTAREQRIYDAGYMTGAADRQPEIDQANADADRLYRAAFDHRNCPCNQTHHPVRSARP